jgi:hypothetical protein
VIPIQQLISEDHQLIAEVFDPRWYAKAVEALEASDWAGTRVVRELKAAIAHGQKPDDRLVQRAAEALESSGWAGTTLVRWLRGTGRE